MKSILQLLKQLETDWPPPPGAHHAVIATGDKLSLQINYHGTLKVFTIDEKDMQRSPKDLAEEISGLLKKAA